MAVFAGGSAAIKKAHIAKATSDLHNFQIAVEMTLNETPRVANIATETKKAQLESIMDALNDNLAADYKLTAVDGTLTGNITKDAPTAEDTNYIICQSDKTDAWGNPYFMIIDCGERGGSASSEFYMTAVTAGPNSILHLDGNIDTDDVFSLTGYTDGDVISETYNMAEAAPTSVGATAKAVSFTDAETAPVNNGVTIVTVKNAAPVAEPVNQEPVNEPIDEPANQEQSDYNVVILDADGGTASYTKRYVSLDCVEVTLTASPNSGKKFTRWTITGDYEVVSGNLDEEVLTIRVTSDISVTPTFNNLSGGQHSG